MTTKKKSGSSLRRTRKGRGLPRIMWVAIAVCVIGAVLIFRDQSSDVPTGIGEYQTVVTAPETETNLPDTEEPRSGDVEISAETQPLTPEKPEGGSAVPAEEKTPAKTEVKPAPAKPKPAVTSPPPERIQPVSNGPYMVQTASFGDADNADKEAQRLRNLGYDARVKMGNTSDDKLFYRVKIGYFKSRTEALAYIKQNHRHMPNAIPAHR